MIPLLLTGSLVLASFLCAILARALRERDMARVSLSIARMEVLELRTRLQDTHRRVVELERAMDTVHSNAAESPEWIRNRIEAGKAGAR
jgi:hypothetical protein